LRRKVGGWDERRTKNESGRSTIYVPAADHQRVGTGVSHPLAEVAWSLHIGIAKRDR